MQEGDLLRAGEAGELAGVAQEAHRVLGGEGQREVASSGHLQHGDEPATGARDERAQTCPRKRLGDLDRALLDAARVQGREDLQDGVGGGFGHGGVLIARGGSGTNRPSAVPPRSSLRVHIPEPSRLADTP